MVMIGNVPRFVLEKEEVHELVEADPPSIAIIADIPVFDHVQRHCDSRFDTSLFADLTHGSLLGLLSLVDDAFRELPSIFRTDADDGDLRSAGGAAIHHAAGRDLAYHRQGRAWHLARRAPPLQCAVASGPVPRVASPSPSIARA